jgi:PadR family transcriptional regulator, regulatory protein PadR
MAEKSELLQGTLDLLVLRVLNGGALHGFGIAQRIHVLSNQSLELQEGSLYPALYRMERKGWIKAEWGISDQNRKAKFYALTSSGRKQLQAEQDAWKRLATAIGAVLRGAD